MLHLILFINYLDCLFLHAIYVMLIPKFFAFCMLNILCSTPYLAWTTGFCPPLNCATFLPPTCSFQANMFLVWGRAQGSNFLSVGIVMVTEIYYPCYARCSFLQFCVHPSPCHKRNKYPDEQPNF